MKNIYFMLSLIWLFVIVNCSVIEVTAEDSIATSYPMTTDLSGKHGALITQSTFRILVPSKNRGGTAFLHKSGRVITAAHIVKDCIAKDIILVGSRKQKYKITKIISDSKYDLALLTPEKKIKTPPLTISSNDNISIGAHVTTWGFPSGYNGLVPLLSVGYLSGVDDVKTDSGKLMKRWVINAAFNSGNSGGPLINVEDGTVIGVVSSKLAPIPAYIKRALEVLKKQTSGLSYTKTKTDGTTERVSEGQVIADVLQYLRNQTQLVIGHTVLLADIKEYLKKNGVEP